MSATAAVGHTVRYGRDRSWIPVSDWGPRSTRVAGVTEDGTAVDVATVGDPTCWHRRRAAHDAWLHGRVLVVEGSGPAPLLVLPLERLEETAVGMAVRTWRLGQAVAAG